MLYVAFAGIHYKYVCVVRIAQSLTKGENPNLQSKVRAERCRRVWLGASDLEEEVLIEVNNDEHSLKVFLVKLILVDQTILDIMVLVISQLDDHELQSSKKHCNFCTFVMNIYR